MTIRDACRRIVLLPLLGFSVVLGACAHGPDPLEEHARADYTAASQDPTVQQYAGVQLYEAKQALDRLHQAVRHGEDQVELKHRAYVAKQRVEIARVAAQGASLEAQTKSLTEKRDQMRLDAREQEARAAKNRAETAEAAAASAEQRASTAEEQLAEELKAKETERGLVLTLPAGMFAVDKTELQPGAAAELDRITSFLQAHPERKVLVEGHTDDTGTEQYNMALSERRAQVVAHHLESRGIDSSRIEVQGEGESSPVAPNDTPAGRQQNRRVEVVIRR
jgi:outer membrane protein OmpA-like peptidoglycan-associated protein